MGKKQRLQDRDSSMQRTWTRRVKEQYRISCAPGYVVGEDGEVYRLPMQAPNGAVFHTYKLIPFGAGQYKCPSYDLRINGKVKRFSKVKLEKYYVEVPYEIRRWILLSDS